MRQCFGAHEANTDDIANSLIFFINTMQRVDSVPEERVLAGVFFFSVSDRLDMLFDVTNSDGIDALRKRIEDFELLKILTKKYTHKATETINGFINPLSGTKGFISFIESNMKDLKYKSFLGEKEKAIVWNTPLRDLVRSRLIKSSS